MAFKIMMTLKYRVNELRADDEDNLTEITDAGTIKVFRAVEERGFRPWESTSVDVDGVRYNDLTYLVDEAGFEALAKAVDLSAVEVERDED